MSKFYVLSSEPKEHKSFCPDTRPGGPVTGATGKNLMCKSFMCLFCSLFLGIRREESGMSREFCRDVPDPWGCSRSLCQKQFVRIFRSLTMQSRVGKHLEVWGVLVCRRTKEDTLNSGGFQRFDLRWLSKEASLNLRCPQLTGVVHTPPV